MDYTLNPEAAKQADNLFSRIEEKGKYLGTLTRAEQIVSKKGSKGVDFSFKTDTGATRNESRTEKRPRFGTVSQEMLTATPPGSRASRPFAGLIYR